MRSKPVVQSSALSIVAVVLLATPLVMWQDVLRYLPAYLQGSAPAGQATYLLAKLAGTMAMILLLLQLLLAVSGRLLAFPRLRLSRREHRRLGIATLTMSLLHALAFAAAASLRTEHLAWKILTPVFSEGYWRSLVSVGWVALIGLLIAAAAGLWRTRSRWVGAVGLHRLGAGLGLLALWHSIAIGSESTVVIVVASVLALGSVVLACVGQVMRRRLRHHPMTGDSA